MEHSLSPEISGLYEPRAESGATLRKWHDDNEHTTKFIMAHQVVFPLLAALLIILSATVLICVEPFSYGNKVDYILNAEIDDSEESIEKTWETITSISVISVLSFWITLYISIMDAIGLVIAISDTNTKELRMDYSLDESVYSFNTTPPLKISYSLTVWMMVQSLAVFISLIVWIVVMKVVARSVVRIVERIIGINLVYDNGSYLPSFTYLYLPVFLLVNILIHFTHILIGFIHNPFHATSVGIFYVGVVIMILLILKVISYLYKLWVFSKHHRRPQCHCMILTVIYSVVIPVCMGFAIFMAALYILIPINHAFDDAPDRLRTIYDTLIVAFTGAIAYFLFQEKRREKEKREAELQRGNEQLQILKEILKKQGEEQLKILREIRELPH